MALSGLNRAPVFTSEQAITLRAFVAGHTAEQIRHSLHMNVCPFLRLMHELREKTGTMNNASLARWAQERIITGDQRLSSFDI
jgi:hypothetical protein